MQLPSNPNPNLNLQIGNLPVDFGKKDFRHLTDDAKLVPLDGNDSKGWDTIADKVDTTGQVGDDDMAKLKTFSQSVSSGKTSLKGSLIQVLTDKTATPAQKNEAKKKLADVNCFSDDYYSLTEALKGATAKAAVAAAAGASFGPTGVLTAYQTYANLDKGELKEVVTDIEGLRNGKAPFIYPGNKVKQVHQEVLWQSMNQMLDSGVTSAKSGKPVPVMGQYYELTSQQIVGKFAANAKAGNPVYINMDPSRITPPPRDKVINLDDTPDKLRSALQLMDSGCAVSTYPCATKLGDPADLMHRKLLGVGDDVLLSGMNANEGSGENIDRGYIMTGPAAHRKGQDFIRDVKDSIANPSLEDRYGDKEVKGFPSDIVKMGTRGLTALIDTCSQGGPSPAGTPLETVKNADELKAYAQKKGFDLGSIIDAPAADLDAKLASMFGGEHQHVVLTDKGKQMVMDLMNRVNDRVKAPENTKKFDSFQLPSEAPAGHTTVTLADVPAERQATVLETIQNADKFIEAPTFVITKPIAAALSQKKDEMAAAGKPFEIRMVADSGIYPDGGTPNTMGVTMLEDHGITPRWTLLPRSGSHDRKIHAKDILTDKAEWFGSTNLSGKGMKGNWEHSGIVTFDPKDADSMAMRQHAEDLFNDLWTNMSFECNTKDAATYLVKDKYHYQERDVDAEIDRNRTKVVDKLLANLESFEKESGTFVQKQVADSPKVQARIRELEATGMDDGNATLVAVAENMGKDNFYKAMHDLPSVKQLQFMKPPAPKAPG